MDLRNIKWLAPWMPVPESSAEVITAELDRELAPSHPLSGRGARVVARRCDKHDVLCTVADDPECVALVHLSWSGKRESPPWPMTTFFSSAEHWQRDAMIPDSRANEADPGGAPITLWRPVGPEELELIKQSGWREFPPRLPEQPIFYPVTNLEYARQIAREWNVAASGTGYVVRFRVSADYLREHPKRIVGARVHEEYWIPAEDLARLNANIVGLIELAEEHG